MKITLLVMLISRDGKIVYGLFRAPEAWGPKIMRGLFGGPWDLGSRWIWRPWYCVCTVLCRPDETVLVRVGRVRQWRWTRSQCTTSRTSSLRTRRRSLPSSGSSVSGALCTSWPVTERCVTPTVSFNWRLVERCRPQFVADFHQLLSAARKCDPYDVQRLSAFPWILRDHRHPRSHGDL